MKILFCSYAFAPGVGGTETVGRLLAQEFLVGGHEVRVLTNTRGGEISGLSVTREPNPVRVASLVRWADVVFHNHISLHYAWPLALSRKPWIVTHHTWIDPRSGWTEQMKRGLLKFATNIAISPAVAAALPYPSVVIPDPYDAKVFFVRPGAARDRDLVFVGRLVPDKGCDLLLEALKSSGAAPSLTIIGDGPERQKLERLAPDNAVFTGMLPPEGVARELNRHRICVVPSRWDEPFGVVALEAIACGCAVIGSSGGGLPAAIGQCGRLFSNGSVDQLADLIKAMLAQDLSNDTCHAGAHLRNHHPATIARQYLNVFETALCNFG